MPDANPEDVNFTNALEKVINTPIEEAVDVTGAYSVHATDIGAYLVLLFVIIILIVFILVIIYFLGKGLKGK